ncbi:EamA family transporter [Methanobacterium ferruginis]|uniref:EamA family transporter n=1 Tax=Methanobacterium ferruginis TaxID=710191 RepID=UPI00257237C8|nr:EamA family transporter [Methanobacterium ferruginis]
MFWLIFAWLTALFESLTDVASKKGLQYLDEYTVAFSIRFFTFIFLIPVLVLIAIFLGLPYIGSQFWTALLIGGSLNVVTTVLYMKALKYSDLSISVPMLTFTPLFLLVTSPLILGEFPSLLGLLGIFLIVSGSYLLNIKEWKQGYLAPFKALFRERGPKLMLIVAFLWSITSNYDKVGALNSSLIIWILAVNLFIAICMIPILIKYSLKSSQETSFLSPSSPETSVLSRSSKIRSGRDKDNIVLIQQNRKILVIMGLLSTLTSIFQIYAITLTLVAYVIAIKRTSVVFSVLWGHYIFHEKGVKERLLGASIMVMGVVCIVLS